MHNSIYCIHHIVKVFVMQWSETLVRDAISCGMCVTYI